MSPLYAGIGGVVRELTEMDAGINGVVTPLTEMWAGVGGVQRQIFSAVKLATWQKWSIKTSYSYSEETRSNIYVTSGSNEAWLYYSQSIQITSGTYDKKLTDITDIFTNLTVSGLPFTSPAPKNGYYFAYNDTKELSRCSGYYIHKDWSLTNVGTNFWKLPNYTLLYFALETKTVTKGDNMLGTITAPEGTYPDNGQQGEYWYVKI